MSGRNSQVVRVLKIHNFLVANKDGYSVSEIQEKLDGYGLKVTKRTLYRDLDAIDQAGVSLINEVTHSDSSGHKWKLFKP